LQGLNASIRLFFWPRNTIKWIINHDPNYGVMLIAMLSGVTAAIRTSAIHGLHPIPDLIDIHPLLSDIIAFGIGASASLPMSVATISLYGGTLGVLLLFAGSAGLLIIGWLLGGVGRYQEVRAALAWSFVPYTWLFPVWAIYSLANSFELRLASFSFGTYFPWEVVGSLSVMLLIDYLVRIFCLVWLVLKLSVVLRTSITRTIFIVLISFLPPAILLAPWQSFSF